MPFTRAHGNWKLLNDCGDDGNTYAVFQNTETGEAVAEVAEPAYHGDRQAKNKFGGKKMLVYRIDLEVAGAEDYDLDAVAQSCGIDRIEYTKALDSKKPLAIWYVWQDIAGYYGWGELDSDPLCVSEKELQVRWYGSTAKKAKKRGHTTRWSVPKRNTRKPGRKIRGFIDPPRGKHLVVDKKTRVSSFVQHTAKCIGLDGTLLCVGKH